MPPEGGNVGDNSSFLREIFNQFLRLSGIMTKLDFEFVRPRLNGMRDP
jgi:hypothetical protein